MGFNLKIFVELDVFFYYLEVLVCGWFYILYNFFYLSFRSIWLLVEIQFLSHWNSRIIRLLPNFVSRLGKEYFLFILENRAIPAEHRAKSILIPAIHTHTKRFLLPGAPKLIFEPRRFILNFFASKNMLHEILVSQGFWPGFIQFELEIFYIDQLDIWGKTVFNGDYPVALCLVNLEVLATDVL